MEAKPENGGAFLHVPSANDDWIARKAWTDATPAPKCTRNDASNWSVVTQYSSKAVITARPSRASMASARLRKAADNFRLRFGITTSIIGFSA
jgi:hypothetical protein